MKTNRKQQLVDQFNASVPVGAPVRVRLDSGELRETKVTMPADLLGGHTPVVWLEGISGCYALDRVQIGGAR